MGDFYEPSKLKDQNKREREGKEEEKDSFSVYTYI